MVEEKTTKVESNMNLRDRILNTNDTRERLVDVSQWGWGTVLCRNLSGLERAALSKLSTFRIQGTVTSKQTTADTVILGSYDPDTKQKLFKETDRDALLAHNSAPLEKLAEVINDLSGITFEAEKEAEKN